MSTNETDTLTELWKQVADLREQAFQHGLAGRHAESDACHNQATTIRNQIHSRYMASLAMVAVYGGAA